MLRERGSAGSMKEVQEPDAWELGGDGGQAGSELANRNAGRQRRPGALAAFSTGETPCGTSDPILNLIHCLSRVLADRPPFARIWVPVTWTSDKGWPQSGKGSS